MAEEEIAFSLELFVQYVEIYSQLQMNKTAVAFRLFDFPSVIVHGEEEKEIKETRNEKSLRNKLIDFNKGKSCLFTLKESQIYELVEKIPLYVMLIDIATTGAKLIGTVAISLSNFITAKIIPSMESRCGYRKGEFQLYDLMANEVGKMQLILRLSCLGKSIIPHIQAIQLKKEVVNKPPPILPTVVVESGLELCDDPLSLIANKLNSSNFKEEKRVPNNVLANEKENLAPGSTKDAISASCVTELVSNVPTSAVPILLQNVKGSNVLSQNSNKITDDLPPALYFIRNSDGCRPMGSNLQINQKISSTQMFPGPCESVPMMRYTPKESGIFTDKFPINTKIETSKINNSENLKPVVLDEYNTGIDKNYWQMRKDLENAPAKDLEEFKELVQPKPFNTSANIQKDTSAVRNSKTNLRSSKTVNFSQLNTRNSIELRDERLNSLKNKSQGNLSKPIASVSPQKKLANSRTRETYLNHNLQPRETLNSADFQKLEVKSLNSESFKIPEKGIKQNLEVERAVNEVSSALADFLRQMTTLMSRIPSTSNEPMSVNKPRMHNSSAIPLKLDKYTEILNGDANSAASLQNIDTGLPISNTQKKEHVSPLQQNSFETVMATTRSDIGDKSLPHSMPKVDESKNNSKGANSKKKKSVFDSDSDEEASYGSDFDKPSSQVVQNAESGEKNSIKSDANLTEFVDNNINKPLIDNGTKILNTQNSAILPVKVEPEAKLKELPLKIPDSSKLPSLPVVQPSLLKLPSLPIILHPAIEVINKNELPTLNKLPSLPVIESNFDANKKDLPLLEKLSDSSVGINHSATNLIPEIKIIQKEEDAIKNTKIFIDEVPEEEIEYSDDFV